jgi:hypothetical protein
MSDRFTLPAQCPLSPDNDQITAPHLVLHRFKQRNDGTSIRLRNKKARDWLFSK